MRIVSLVAAYNEERFIGGCLERLFSQGVKVYLIDNGSTDRTVQIAESYKGSDLLGIETLPRTENVYRWRDILRRKEELALSIDADWFMHADPDEIRIPPRSGVKLSQAFEEVDEQGYNAVNFIEFTFIPTRESPDHDHPDFRQTMKWYYPFALNFPSQVKAWKQQPVPVDLVSSGGHRVKFTGLCIYPESFKMKHYQFLSVPQLLTKYTGREYDAGELKMGMHGWRAHLSEQEINLPPQSILHTYTSDDDLDLSAPRVEHLVQQLATSKKDEKLETPRILEQNTGSSPLTVEVSSPLTGPSVARSELPVIVGGCYRSGTSLIRRVLGAHSRIYCGPEVKFFRDFHSDYLNDPIRHGRYMTSARQILPEPALARILGNSFVTLHKRAAARAKKPRWADKNPENVLYLKEWQKLLDDNWLFVHVVRNPLDTLASIKEVKFPLVIPPDLDGRIEVYKSYTQAGLNFEELHPERYHRVVYEQLVEYPAATIQSLMEWLGEEFEKAQLDFNSFSHQRGLEDPKVQHTTEVHGGSVGRWKELLTPDEIEQISRECDPLWRKVSDRYNEERNPKGTGLLRRLGF